MLYEVEGIQDDKRVKKRFEAENETDLNRILLDYNFVPLKIKSMTKKGSVMGLFNKISFDDIVNFTRQLAMMLNAGLSLVDSFNILKKQSYKESMLKFYEDVDKDIKSGLSLSTALGKYKGTFSSVYISLVKAGEASGKMSDILLRLAENLEESQEFRGMLKSALIYPVLVVVVMIAVIFIMITFVIPKLLDIYKNFQMDLPITTQILMVVSDFSSKYWYFIIILVGLAVYMFKSYIKTEQGKLAYDSFLLRLPYMGDVIAKGILVETTRTLAILTRSGVSILESLDIITETTDNLIYKNAFKRIYDQVKKGVSIGDAMQMEEMFPPMLVQMVKVGENTGHLDDTLERVAKYFEMESRIAIKAMTSLIEPAILIVLALGVGFLVISVITPIYNLTSAF
ncbi:MAG: type II secretion system protein F [Patescibacteria group bacterium]|nr:MAG: type II secretion system protein F [Patescibacteria group bacterium]